VTCPDCGLPMVFIFWCLSSDVGYVLIVAADVDLMTDIQKQEILGATILTLSRKIAKQIPAKHTWNRSDWDAMKRYIGWCEGTSAGASQWSRVVLVETQRGDLLWLAGVETRPDDGALNVYGQQLSQIYIV
jgi:hypothetical protein